MGEDTPDKYVWSPCLLRFLCMLEIIPISSDQFRAIAAVQIWLKSVGKSQLTLKLHGVLVLIELLLKEKESVIMEQYGQLQVQLFLYLPSMFNLKHYSSQQGRKWWGFFFFSFFFSKNVVDYISSFPFPN